MLTIVISYKRRTEIDKLKELNLDGLINESEF